MKFMRLAMCVAAFAVIGKAALSEDVDVRALQAKLAAQEARLADLQSRVNYNEANANYAGAPEAIVSLNKNACVTIGGNLNTRYFYRNAKIDSVAPNAEAIGDSAATAAGYTRRARVNQSDLVIADAKVYVQIDVNDYFDAFIQMDLHSSNDDKSDNAEKYYVRWKNVCNSGFGVKVGRDALVFGEDQGMGILGSYTKNGDGAFKDANWGTYGSGGAYGIDAAGNILTQVGMNDALGRRGSFGDGLLPAHNYWDQGRIIQVTPYWEGLDGKFKAEVSLFQEEDNWSTRFNNGSANQIYLDGHKYKSRNYGFGSMSARIGYMPIEGLKFSASIVNFYDKNPQGYWASTSDNGMKKNNTAVDAAISYRPAFFNRLNMWVQYMHGWNVNHYDDMDSDAISYGASFDLNESWSIFAQGDYLRTKDGFNGADFKDTAWAVYGGVKYVLPYGVNLEAGWKHEQITWKEHGNKQAKGKGDTAYVHLGFDF